MFRWLFGWLNKPIIVQDATDDELPYEARSTWERLDDAYGFDDEED